MSKNLIICRYMVYVIFCLCAVAYTANRQMIFTPICLLFATAAFIGLGAEEVENLKK